MVALLRDDELGAGREVDDLALCEAAFERAASAHRGEGVGTQLVEAVVAWGLDRGCGVRQLATDVARPDALRSSEPLGLTATHVGLERPTGRRVDRETIVT